MFLAHYFPSPVWNRCLSATFSGRPTMRAPDRSRKPVCRCDFAATDAAGPWAVNSASVENERIDLR